MAVNVATNFATDLGSPPDPTQTFYFRNFLDRAMYYNYHARWATPRPLKEKAGHNVIFRRWLHLAAASSPLTEGVPPTGKTPDRDDYTTRLRQYGDFIALSDFASMTQIDDVGTEWSGLLGEQGGYTMDIIDRDSAIAGTTVLYSNGAARSAVTTIVDGNDLDRMIRTLTANGGRTLLGGTGGSTTVGTSPSMPCYPCITHPNVLFDLQNIEGYKPASELPGATAEEWGRYRQLAFFGAHDASNVGAGAKVYTGSGGSSTAVKNTAGTVDVYTILALAKDGFTSIPFNGRTVSLIRKPLGSAGSGDPIDQVSTMGWKNTSARMITNDAWLCRLECAASL